MHNKKMIAKGLIIGAVISNPSINSMANAIEDYNINRKENEDINLKKEEKEDKIIDIKESLDDFFENLFNRDDNESNYKSNKEVIKTNPNIRTGTVLEITLSDGQFIEDLSGNPGGYETVRVTTEGGKKLVKQDYDKLRLSGIPKVDLSNAWSDAIPEGAFSNATHLTEFKFPQGIKSISLGVSDYSQGSFYNCINLSGSLTIPESVTTIGDYAFRHCSRFTGSLTIPNSVTTIGTHAFSGCTGFNGSLTIPNSVTTIGNYAFNGCSGFNGSLTIPESVTTIGQSAFSGCSGFNGSLTIPNSVTTIGTYAFNGCSGFNGSLTISESVTIIGTSAFHGCSGFTGSLTIPESVTTIGTSAFHGCSGFAGSLTIPNSVTTIRDYAFSGCSGFNGSLNLSNSLKSIGQYAFEVCSGFTGNLIIPESVTTIGTSAFRDCSGLTGDLVIPNSVRSIGSNAFNGCSKIEKIVVKVSSSDADTNYKESMIANLPNTTQTVIDIPYDFNVVGTWLETTNKTTGKPVIKNIVDGVESELVNSKGEIIYLHIPSTYQESNISVLKDGENYTLPTKNSEDNYIFIENGIYQVTITTDLGNTSVITFEVEDAQLRDARDAVDKAEGSNESLDLNNARDLVNKLPESLIKDQLQIRLNNISPSLTLERESVTSNVDIYIKSENMLRLTLDTNSITFENFSGIQDVENLNAINLTVNSSLPYKINAYMPTDIENADGTNIMNKEILNIRANGQTNYNTFVDNATPIVLLDDQPADNDARHGIDLMLKGRLAHEKDVYKTTIKFEVEQK